MPLNATIIKAGHLASTLGISLNWLNDKNTRTALEEMGITDFDVDLISFVPQVEAPIEGEDVEVMERFLTMLEDCDDVQNVYHNAQF